MKTLTNNILIFFSTLLIILVSACTGEDSRQMHEALMQAKAQNENFEPFTTDSTMLRVVDYYDAHGSANEQMLAHYLLGCVYRDLGDAPRALECYYDAVSKADTTDADCDFQRLNRIYGQMANLFHAQRSPQFEKDAELNAIRMAWIAKDTLAVNYLNSHKSANLLYHLEKSKNIYYIAEGERNYFGINSKTIYWNPYRGILTSNGEELSPTVLLNHEIDHALGFDINRESFKLRKKTKDDSYSNLEEKRVITGSEQKTAKALGGNRR